MPHQFQGTGVALITPFKSDGSIDYAALEQLINHVIENGINYLVALGTTSEAPVLTAEEKAGVLSFIIEKCNDRVPIVCGIGGNNTAEVIHQVKTYNLNGVAGILSVTPYYNKPIQEGIYQHFKAIASATDKPVILYNVPGRTSCNIMPATAIRLANDFKNIVAIKEASGNLAQCMELIQYKPQGFAVLSGDDNLVVSQIAVGMEGIISVAANCFTKDFTDMVNATLDNDYNIARMLLYKLLPGIDLLFIEGNPGGVKAVLAQMRICKNVLRLPLVPVSDTTAENIDGYMQTLHPGYN